MRKVADINVAAEHDEHAIFYGMRTNTFKLRLTNISGGTGGKYRFASSSDCVRNRAANKARVNRSPNCPFKKRSSPRKYGCQVARENTYRFISRLSPKSKPSSTAAWLSPRKEYGTGMALSVKVSALSKCFMLKSEPSNITIDLPGKNILVTFAGRRFLRRIGRIDFRMRLRLLDVDSCEVL